MFFKYYPLILLFNQNLVYGFRFFDIMNTIKYFNENLRPEEAFRSTDLQTRWFKQELDHFDSNETRTWKMKYFERLDFWKFNGPIYLYVGGEGPASSTWIKTGIMYELAKETNGALYVTEHRYYGESMPLNTTNVENFKFLTSRQSLADTAKFLRYLKSRRMFKTAKVVVVGGSYAGNLAAWMRMLYPELVDAALSSSGPILAKIDFFEYLEKVGDNYDRYGTSECLDNVRNIFGRYNRLLNSSEGIEILKEEEDICEECDLTVMETQHLFIINKISDFMYYSQYGNTTTFKNHCKEIKKSLQPTVSQNETNSSNSSERCGCPDFSSMIRQYYYRENAWLMSWNYQTCSEFGLFQTSSSEAQPFTDKVRLDFYIKTCSTLFGAEYNEERISAGIKKTNEFYGGLTPNVTKVVFTNGDLDPWSTLGILKNLSTKAPAVVIPRASHCQDLFSNKKGDIPELKEARQQVKNMIKNWIGIKISNSSPLLLWLKMQHMKRQQREETNLFQTLKAN